MKLLNLENYLVLKQSPYLTPEGKSPCLEGQIEKTSLPLTIWVKYKIDMNRYKHIQF